MTPVRPAALSHRRLPARLASAVAAAFAVASAAHAADTCRSASPAESVPVVELYSSEGCNSCPPADRWLSALKADPAVVALAFHVDYWDRLGWKDRFAEPTYSARQVEQQASNGARFSYTPQVVVDGRDRKDWPQVSMSVARPAAPVALALWRDGDRFVASVRPLAGAPQRLAGYWAVTEQSHVTAVRGGENQGATLHHDFVVRQVEPVAAWPVRAGTVETVAFKPPGRADPAHPRSINFVAVDAGTGRPVQAVKVGC